MCKYFFLALAIILAGCSEHKTTETAAPQLISIDIEDEPSQDLPEVSIKAIAPLETNKSSMFGHFMKLEYYSNRVFVLDAFDAKSLLAFSNDGHFVNKTQLGKGPEEMINPFAFCIDKEKDHILVWDQTLSEMFTFDLDLNFISKTPHDIIIQQFEKVSKNSMLVFAHFYGDFFYKLYSKQFDKVKGKYMKDSKYPGACVLSKPINTGRRTLVISPLNYNIFELTEKGLPSRYLIDFGKYNVKEKDVLKWDFKSVRKQIRAGQVVSSLDGIIESDSFIIFQVYFKNKRIYYAHSKKAGKTYRLNDYFDNNTLPECHVHGVVKNDVFYATAAPDKLAAFQKRSMQSLPFKKLSENDNCAIITFSLNETPLQPLASSAGK